MKTLEGLRWQQRYNEHMGCVKGCLDYLGIGVSFPWLFGCTGHAFALNMNATVFVDCALAWDGQMLLDLAPNLGYRVESIMYDHSVARDAPEDVMRQWQREAWDFVRASIDRGLPCYGWELGPIPAYSVINGYDDEGYTYSGYTPGGFCPWEKLGTFDVRSVQVYRVEPCEPVPDEVAAKEALKRVLEHVERPDGWAISSRYRTGLPGYELWADSLEAGRANRDGQAYLNQVWLECREMAVEFLKDARERLPGRCDAAFDDAGAHYALVRDKLQALLEMHPEREKWDWETTFASPEGAFLLREAGAAECRGVECLKQITGAL
jgi:hypothetical protein